MKMSYSSFIIKKSNNQDKAFFKLFLIHFNIIIIMIYFTLLGKSRAKLDW